jgi:tripartite-type tricarboxylate transporter receptor subunit TctC
MEALKSSLGLVMTHIPFKGTSESVPALLGGHVDVAFSAYPSLSGAVGSKSITLLATNGAKRSAIAPDVPPVADWIPGYSFAPVIGVYARTGTPPAILQKIASEVAAIVKEPEIVKQFATAGIEPLSGGPAEHLAHLKGEDERIAKTVKAAGMTPQ